MTYRIEGFHNKHGIGMEIADSLSEQQTYVVRSQMDNLCNGGPEHVLVGSNFFNLHHFSAIRILKNGSEE